MTILVAVDDSDAAADALRWGLRLASARGSTLTALRCWSYGRLAEGSRRPDPEAMDREVAGATAGFAERVLGPEAAVRVEVARGPARHAVLDAVTRLRPDVVVVGHRPLNELDSRLLGSVGRRLVEAAPCPVVLVREGTRRTTSAPAVVVGVDGSPAASAAASWAAGVAADLGDELVVVHAALTSPQLASGTTVADPAGEHHVLAEVSQQLDRAGRPHRAVLEWGDPRVVVEEVAQRERAELVVVGRRGRGRLARLVLGSVAGYATHHLAVPVAVVPPPD